MFIYFDRNGVLQEVINDKAARLGDLNANEIYVYVDEVELDDIWLTLKRPDGTLSVEKSFIANKVVREIPYDPKRDMKFFKDYKEYEFYKFTITDEITIEGVYQATIRMTYEDTLSALGVLVFKAETGVIKSDQNITQAQYDYLIWYVGSWQGQIGDLEEAMGIAQADILNLQNRMNVAESDINKIEDGTTVVNKALKDDLGNTIKSTYANKLDLAYSSSNNRIAITLKSYDGTPIDADLIDLPKATTSADGLLSKEDKTKLNNIIIDVSNKLDKVWSTVVSQTMLNLTDEFVINRGNQVYKTTLSTLLGSLIPTDIFIVVNLLPEEGQPNKIYLVPKEGEEPQNGFDEYVWIDEDWEKLGSIDIDLSNYYTKTETDNLVEQNKQIFLAEFGVTTYAEIENALAQGLFPIAIKDGYYYTYIFTPSPTIGAYFQNIWLGTNKHIYVNNTNVWATRDVSTELASNKTDTLTSSSTTTQYPNAKVVYDLGESKVDKNANITGATKTKITYDSKGLVTAGADLVESDIPPLAISKITGLQTALDDIEQNGVPYLTTAPISANTNGNLIMVVLTSEPTTKYAGYFYIITE